MGRASGREKPRRARAVASGETHAATRPNRQGARSRRRRETRTGRRLARSRSGCGPRGTRSRRIARRKPLERGRGRRKPIAPHPDVGQRNRPDEPDRKGRGGRAGKANRRRKAYVGDTREVNRKRGGAAERRRRHLPGEALKGEPRGRARLRHTGEAMQGARRRGGQEPRGRNMTRELEGPGAVALHGWVASRGKRTSRERVARAKARARGFTGKTLKRDRSLREWPNR